MKINRQELLKALTAVKPGLTSVEILEQSTSFVFKKGRVYTYNDEIAISHPVDKSLSGVVSAKEFYELLNRYTDKQLARLVTTLRQQKRYGTLSSERELALHRIDFDFEPMQSQWINIYNKMVEYYRLNGHASPNRRSNNEHERALADWTHRMHKMIRKNELDDEKLYKLKLLNIDGKPSEHRIGLSGLPASFEQNLERLNKYINSNGTFIHAGISDPTLYKWILFQQQRINASLITPTEYSALIKTGFQLEQSKNYQPSTIVNFN